MSSIDPRSSDIAVPRLDGVEGFEYLAAQRRNRLIGLWAGEKMGLNGESIESYARALDRGSDQTTEEDVIRKILGDLTASNIAVRESEVRVKAAEFLAQSREAIKAGA